MAAFKSDFALLDVKAGRKALIKRLASGERVPVVIHGVIDSHWTDDDGTSVEFVVDVSSVEEVKA